MKPRKFQRPKQRRLNFTLKAPQSYTSFFYVYTLWLNNLTVKFLLISWSNTVQNQYGLWTVKASLRITPSAAQAGTRLKAVTKT